ncbi:hypothetical protein IAG41_18845 [Sphingomonas sp. JC676]|uniref:hypothetical protein n=1 Tax=Sphingomonas sp. JC676 TaxID=2768065 RepID=UPI0016586B9D|nr:hypothetical protein [Sphingomonas sp. JC676]MBC9034451.1 hypothetical protein [Sphingomonas sp. JC676]
MRIAIPLLLAAFAPQAAPHRIPASEANQGVAAGLHFIYAISNHEIGKYDKRTGKRVLHWEGDPAHFKHMNSCSLIGRELACAASNYPDVPQHSMVEFFDADTLRHMRTVPLGAFPGSLTVLTRHGLSWWAVFANYDDRGGAPGRDHRATLLVELDGKFHEKRRFTFPEAVLERFAPKSCSGGSWKGDLLYVTGHDRPELYALRVPAKGNVLELVATYPIPTNGQAIDWDPFEPATLWSIERKTREMVATPISLNPRSGSPGSR